MSERVPWKESNLALIGSDLDKKIKAAAAEGEEQWSDLGTAPGKKVWRIEQFRVVPWPEEQYGSFHKGDSYVVLNSYTVGDSDALKHDVHIWIGSESSQDEYGTAAYKMVEADDALGGAAIQHRDVQGHESPLFQSYFGYDLKYLEGGVESGFTHVEPTKDEPHLYKVKGTEKGMSLTQVPLSKSSLNKGDSFILFANSELVWLWNGESANPDEKARANSMAEKMCTGGTVVTLDQGAGDEDDGAFWAYLGEGEIQEAGGGDEHVEEFAPLLIQIKPDGSEQVAKGEVIKGAFGRPVASLQQSLLQDDNVYLLDSGWELFLWLGSAADRAEKVTAMSMADAYCREDARTADLPLTMIKSGFETSVFNSYFVA